MKQKRYITEQDFNGQYTTFVKNTNEKFALFAAFLLYFLLFILGTLSVILSIIVDYLPRDNVWI